MPFDVSVSETDSSVLDSPVSDSDFGAFFQLDEEEDSTDRAAVRDTVSFPDPDQSRMKASPPQDVYDELNLKDVDHCEPHDDEASEVSSGGAITTSDGCASPQLLDVPGQAATLCESQDSEQASESPDLHASVEVPTIKDLDDHAPDIDSRKTRKCSFSTSSSSDAPRAKRRRRRREDDPVDEEFFPSRREKKARIQEANG
jgi:hypothetical protein